MCYKGVVVGDYFTDLFVDNKVMVELKVAAGYNSEDEAQLLNALKATGVKVGLLINFGRLKWSLTVSFSDQCFIRVNPWLRK